MLVEVATIHDKRGWHKLVPNMRKYEEIYHSITSQILYKISCVISYCICEMDALIDR